MQQELDLRLRTTCHYRWLTGLTGLQLLTRLTLHGTELSVTAVQADTLPNLRYIPHVMHIQTLTFFGRKLRKRERKAWLVGAI